MSDLAKITRALLLARAKGVTPYDMSARLYGHGPHSHIARFMKAAVDTHDTSSELYSADKPAVQFADALRPLTLIGRLNTVSVPFRAPLPYLTTGIVGDFYGDNTPIGVAAPTFGTNVNLDRTKIAKLIVTSEELLEFTEAEAILERDMRAGVIEAQDRRLVDPTSTATSDRPASITNGQSEIDASGAQSVGDIDGVVNALLSVLTAAGSNLLDAVLITTTENAVALSLTRNTDGSLAYPGVTVRGGTLAGLPLLASSAVPEGLLVAVDGGEILLADGAVEIHSSRVAMVDQADPIEGSTRVSMFQSENIAFKVLKFINWKLRRDAVAYASSFAPPAPELASTA